MPDAPDATEALVPSGFDPLAWRVLAGAWDDAPLLVSVVAGPQHVLTYVNRAVEKLFGGRPLGVPMSEAFPGMNVSALGYFDEVLRTGRTVAVPVRRVAIRDLSGGDVVMRYVLSPLAMPDGPVLGVISHAWDMTAEVRLERSSQRSQLLAEISERMNATVDPSDALQALSEGLVPPVADLAAVYVISGGPDRTSAGRAPVAMSTSDALRALGPPPGPLSSPQPSPYLPGLAAGLALVIDVDEASLPVLAPDVGMRDWLARAEISSLAVVPLLVAGDLTGAVVLATAGTRRPYDSSDVPFLEDVAARAGAAITHVRTVRRSHEVALDLQRALLPAAPPAFPDRQVAGRYLSGVPDVEVGGDWWDVVDVGGGRVALGVGDVSGRGVPAAVVMGQARAAMRATGFAQLEPLEVLGVLDQQLSELVTPKQQETFAPPRFVTAVYGVFEPRAGEIRFGSAGHLPPIVRLPDGRPRIVDIRPGTPLGLRMGGWREVSVPFPAGSIVAMFTDGLVESREQEVDQGMDALAEALCRYGDEPDLEQVAGALIEAMGRNDGHVDDVALLLMRTDESAYPRVTRDLTVRRLREIAAARAESVALLAGSGVPREVCGAAEHVVDELLSNALEHADGPADLHLHVTGVRVVVEVTDRLVTRPLPRDAGDDDERGRGLALTAGLSSRWGVRSGPRGKTVWAEITLPHG